MKNSAWLFSILLLGACRGERLKETGPAEILLAMTTNERYVTTDRVAALMIDKDPSLRIVDVRSRESFNTFTLPGAVNIPLKDFYLPDNQKIMDCDRYKIVFFSNDDLSAGQAWQLSRRSGCANTFIMQGGLNEWTRNFLTPPEPVPTASAADLELYRFRKAACQYFIGASDELEPEKFQEVREVPAARPSGAKNTIQVQPKPPKPAAKAQEEGC